MACFPLVHSSEWELWVLTLTFRLLIWCWRLAKRSYLRWERPGHLQCAMLWRRVWQLMWTPLPSVLNARREGESLRSQHWMSSLSVPNVRYEGEHSGHLCLIMNVCTACTAFVKNIQYKEITWRPWRGSSLTLLGVPRVRGEDKSFSAFERFRTLTMQTQPRYMMQKRTPWTVYVWQRLYIHAHIPVVSAPVRTRPVSAPQKLLQWKRNVFYCFGRKTTDIEHVQLYAAPCFEAIPLVLLAAHGRPIFDSALFLYICVIPHDGMEWRVLLLCLTTEPPVPLLAVRGALFRVVCGKGGWGWGFHSGSCSHA